jgi:hypothetical protein
MEFDDEELVRSAIRAWDPRDLAKYAFERHGYYNTDIGCGITYPGDLDDYDREVDHIVIPEGFVRAAAEWSAREADVPERAYLRILAEELDAIGLTNEATRVRALLLPQ